MPDDGERDPEQAIGISPMLPAALALIDGQLLTESDVLDKQVPTVAKAWVSWSNREASRLSMPPA